MTWLPAPLVASAFVAPALLCATLALRAAPPAPPADPAGGAVAPSGTVPQGGSKPSGSSAAPEAPAQTPAPPKPADKPAPKPPTVVTANDVLHVQPQKNLPRQKFKIFGEEYDCELCLDVVSRDAGMGARTEFPAGTAMIFVHSRPQLLSYWMKDCLIDMDMVMVDSDGIICATHEAVRERLRTKQESLEAYHDRLRRYISTRPAKYVIELPAGTLARLKPRLGQYIDIDWKSLDRRAE